MHSCDLLSTDLLLYYAYYYTFRISRMLGLYLAFALLTFFLWPTSCWNITPCSDCIGFMALCFARWFLTLSANNYYYYNSPIIVSNFSGLLGVLFQLFISVYIGEKAGKLWFLTFISSIKGLIGLEMDFYDTTELPSPKVYFGESSRFATF